MQKKKKITVPGMGAVLHSRGVFFRVWAPNASQVWVTGSFNGWAEEQHPMQAEENGYWGINIPEAKPGQEYKFLLDTAAGRLFRNDPYARELTNSSGNSIIVDPAFDWHDHDFKMPAWNEMVIYEIHIGTFNRSHPDRPGSFDDAIEKLPYLCKLGINAIEIMPPMEFAGGISWGYNPAHPFAVESDYGGANALKRFVDAAHRQGIAVIIDVVYNHFGPQDLDLWQFDGWSENGGGGIYFYQDWRCKTPWGDTRPDYGRSEVRQYIRDNALMWLEEYHADGLRTDAISYIRNVNGGTDPEEDLPDGWSLMQWINKEVRQRYPWKITIAEDMLVNDWITRHEEEGGEGFSSQWDIRFVEPVRKILTLAHDEDRDMSELSGSLLFSYNEDAFQRVIFTESHDEVANEKSRVPEEIAPGDSSNWFAKKRSVLGAVMILTAPGIPMLFQGQEMLENGYFQDTEPLNWELLESFRGIRNLYRDLVHLRLNKHGISKGLTGQQSSILLEDNEKKVLVYHRYHEGGPGDSVVVVLNLANRPYPDMQIPFPAEGLWKVRFHSDWKGYDPSFGDDLVQDAETCEASRHEDQVEGRISLAAYHALILSLDATQV